MSASAPQLNGSQLLDSHQDHGPSQLRTPRRQFARLDIFLVAIVLLAAAAGLVLLALVSYVLVLIPVHPLQEHPAIG